MFIGCALSVHTSYRRFHFLSGNSCALSTLRFERWLHHRSHGSVAVPSQRQQQQHRHPPVLQPSLQRQRQRLPYLPRAPAPHHPPAPHCPPSPRVPPPSHFRQRRQRRPSPPHSLPLTTVSVRPPTPTLLPCTAVWGRWVGMAATVATVGTVCS